PEPVRRSERHRPRAVRGFRHPSVVPGRGRRAPASKGAGAASPPAGPAIDSVASMAGHDETVRQEFSKQAVSFEDPTYSFADRRLMGWILTHVPPEQGERVLDVAGRTGHVARSF